MNGQRGLEKEGVMSSYRMIRKIWKSRPTVEGAGVHLKRAFGNDQVPSLIRSSFSTIFVRTTLNTTSRVSMASPSGHRDNYLRLRGEVEHGDSIGNSGVIHSGDVQWMTAAAASSIRDAKGDKKRSC